MYRVLISFYSFYSFLYVHYAVLQKDTCPVVLQKRAHGWYTLLCAQTGGWADICNIARGAAFYHEKAPMFTCNFTGKPSHVEKSVRIFQNFRYCRVPISHFLCNYTCILTSNLKLPTWGQLGGRFLE